MGASERLDELRKRYDENQRRFFAPLANEYRKAGDLEQAIALCRLHLTDAPSNLSGQIVFGQALFEAGYLDEARSTFETAISLDPENLIALRHLGDIARAQSDVPHARDWYQRVLDADRRNEDVIALLADLEVQGPPQAPVTLEQGVGEAGPPLALVVGPAAPRVATPPATPVLASAPQASTASLIGFPALAVMPGDAAPSAVPPAKTDEASAAPVEPSGAVEPVPDAAVEPEMPAETPAPTSVPPVAGESIEALFEAVQFPVVHDSAEEPQQLSAPGQPSQPPYVELGARQTGAPADVKPDVHAWLHEQPAPESIEEDLEAPPVSRPDAGAAELTPSPAIEAGQTEFESVEFPVVELESAKPSQADAFEFGVVDANTRTPSAPAPVTPMSSFGFDVDLEAAASIPVAPGEDAAPDFGVVELNDLPSFNEAPPVVESAFSETTEIAEVPGGAGLRVARRRVARRGN